MVFKKESTRYEIDEAKRKPSAKRIRKCNQSWCCENKKKYTLEKKVEKCNIFINALFFDEEKPSQMQILLTK